MTPPRITFVLVAFVAACHRTPEALTEGATWTSTEAPPSLAGKVSRYEDAQTFGQRNDPHAWKSVVRYTLRRDAPGPDAGCSFTGWIPGTWSASGDTLTITTDRADSGSLEMHDCPGGRPAVTVTRAPHFTTVSSSYRLDGATLHLDRRVDEGAPITLTRRE